MPSAQQEAIKQQFPDRLTTRELADKIGRSKETVERWRKEGRLIPSEYTMSGQTTVWLYTDDDVRKARELIKRMEA